MVNDKASHVLTPAEADLMNMYQSMHSVAYYGLSGNMEAAQQSLQECMGHVSKLSKGWGFYSSAAQIDAMLGQENLSILEQLERIRQNMPRDPSY